MICGLATRRNPLTLTLALFPEYRVEGTREDRELLRHRIPSDWSLRVGTSIAGSITKIGPMELLPDGARSGTVRVAASGGWAYHGWLLEISGQDGVICQLKRDGDGVWRGNWNQHGRMPIELYPSGADVPPMPAGWVNVTFPECPGRFTLPDSLGAMKK